MPEQQFLSQFFIKIAGKVSKEFMDDVLETVVDSSLYLPEMFTILVQDSDFKWADDTTMLDLGKKVEISAQAGEGVGGQEGLLMKGEIAALEPNFSAQGKTTLLIRGYNKSHRLHRGKQTKTFLKQTDEAIVKKIAGEVGLSPQTDNPAITYDYVIQNNQTNMEFLQARAERLGYKVFAAEEKLYFKKGDVSLGSGPELKFGEELISFQPILAATHQSDKITVLGWDHKQKKAIKGQATPPAALKQGGVKKTGGAAAKSAFGTAEAIVVNQPVFTPGEATALAKGLANDLSGEFIQAEGVCHGHPGIKAGYTVTIKGVGDRFSGKYFVTSATHIKNKEDYETHFSISGRQPNTISSLLDSGNGHNREVGAIQGVAIGMVTNVNDPDDLGRVKVKYPWLGDDIESDWIRIAAPSAGAKRGFFFLPEVNDEVLLSFEHGDIHYPYIVGSLWNSTDKPPLTSSEAVKGGKVNQRIVKSRSGHEIILDDTDGKEQVIIRDKAANEMVIDTTENTMTIKVAGDFIVDATGDIKLTSKGDMVTDSANLTMKAKSNGKVDAGSNLDLTAKTGATLDGGTQANVKGSAGVNLN